MLNRAATAVVRESVIVREYQTLLVTGAKRRGTVYSPSHGRIVGFNFGTSVRPEVAPIKVNTIGDETVESYLARGGRILTGAPTVAKGAMLVRVVKTGTTRVVTSRG